MYAVYVQTGIEGKYWCQVKTVKTMDEARDVCKENIATYGECLFGNANEFKQEIPVFWNVDWKEDADSVDIMLTKKNDLGYFLMCNVYESV